MLQLYPITPVAYLQSTRLPYWLFTALSNIVRLKSELLRRREMLLKLGSTSNNGKLVVDLQVRGLSSLACTDRCAKPLLLHQHEVCSQLLPV